MRTTSVLPVAVALSLLATPLAGSGLASASMPAHAARVASLPATPTSQAQAPDPPAQTDTKKKKKKKKNKAKAEEGADAPAAADEAGKKDGVRMVWKTGPSLRIGKQARVDFRALMQGDLRSSDQDLQAAGGAFDFPRHQLGVKGDVLKVVEFEVMKEVADGPWRDVYVNVRPLGAVQVQAGKFKIPFSMDQLTARRSLDFVYRTLAGETLAPNRDVGFMVHGQLWKRFVRYQVGSFRGDGENAPSLEPPPLLPNELPDTPSKRSVAGRVRVRPLSPLAVPNYFETLEIGASAMHSEVPEGLNHLHGKTLFGTKFFGRNYYTNGARDRRSYEASWTPGPVSLRTEYLRVNELRLGVGSGDETGLDNDLPAMPATGWYVSGTWALTGEKKESGIEPRRPLFQGGFGAIEVAARYEELRFGKVVAGEPPSESSRAASTVTNAEQIFTLGVNWYANRFVKLQLNGIREALEDPSTSPIPGQPSVWTVAFRLQFSM
jgi:phosphate-selective porin OprO/OprP